MRTSLPPGQSVTLPDMQMYYVDAGEGEPLLLLHGYTGASIDWAFCFDELASQYRLIIPDLRGHGRSTNPSGAYTQRQAAHDVQALLDHLGAKCAKLSPSANLRTFHLTLTFLHSMLKAALSSF